MAFRMMGSDRRRSFLPWRVGVNQIGKLLHPITLKHIKILGRNVLLQRPAFHEMMLTQDAPNPVVNGSSRLLIESSCKVLPAPPLGSAIGVALNPRRRRCVPMIRLGSVRVLSGGLAGPVLLMIGLTSTAASTASLLLNLEGIFTLAIAWTIFRRTWTCASGLAQLPS